MAYLKRDMLSINTRNLIADYFADLTLIVDSIQAYRNTLAELPDYDIISLFRFLDRQQKGYLSVSNFQWLITQNSKKLLHYAFSWFDSSKVGQITRLEFIDFLLPRENFPLKQKVEIALTAPRHPEYISQTLAYQVDILKSLILQIIKKETKLIPIRRKIMQQEDYSIQAVMNSIDNDRNDYICVSDLYKFMKNYDIDVKNYHMKELLGNYDSDMNGKISLSELCNLIEGLQNKNSEYRKILRNCEKIRNKSVQNLRQNNKKLKTQGGTAKKIHPQKYKKVYHTAHKSKTHKNKQNNISFAKQSISQFDKKNISDTQQNTDNKVINNLSYLRKNFQLIQQKAKTVDNQLIKLGTQLQQSAKNQFQQHLQQIAIQKRIQRQQLIRKQQQIQQRLLLKQKKQMQRNKLQILQKQKEYLIERQLSNNIRHEVQVKWALQQQKINDQAQKIMQLSRREQSLAARSYVQSRYHVTQPNIHYERSLCKLDKYLIEDDPLGIKSHLRETDKYLKRSKQLRQRIQQQKYNELKIREYIQPNKLAERSQSVNKKHYSLNESGWQNRYNSPKRSHYNKNYNIYCRTAAQTAQKI